MSMNIQMKQLTMLGLCSLVLAGCGSGGIPPGSPLQGCTPTGFAEIVRPANPLAAPDHSLMPPGNQEFYIAAVGSEIGPNCASTNLYKPMSAQWVTSDPADVSISSADDATNGLATCTGPTPPGATVTATLKAYGFTQTLSSPITCR